MQIGSMIFLSCAHFYAILKMTHSFTDVLSDKFGIYVVSEIKVKTDSIIWVVA
jgi:hypothetical protein